MTEADLEAMAAEEQAQPFTWDHEGETFVFPPTLGLRSVGLMSKGDICGAVELLLGADQWDRLCKLPDVPLPELESILGDYGKHIGVPMGKS